MSVTEYINPDDAPEGAKELLRVSDTTAGAVVLRIDPYLRLALETAVMSFPAPPDTVRKVLYAEDFETKDPDGNKADGLQVIVELDHPDDTHRFVYVRMCINAKRIYAEFAPMNLDETNVHVIDTPLDDE
jgi:hypothetical protein